MAISPGTQGSGNDNSQTSPHVHWHMVLAAIAANICTVNCGCISGWTSSTEKFLVIDGIYPGPIDQKTWGLVASLFLLGAMASPIIQGFLTDRFGRKPCFMLIGATSIASWVLTAAANGATMILIARFLGGMAVMAHFLMLAMYIAEISTDNMRSTLGSLMQFSVNLGYLISYSIGPYVKPLTLALVSGAVPLAFILLFFFMPESPYVLVAKGNLQGASKALAWLRGQSESSPAVEKELASIQASIQEANAERAPLSEKLASLLGKRGNLKAFLICIGLFIFAQLTGIIPVLFFAESIFRATGTTLDPAVCTIIIGLVQLVASCGTIGLTRFMSMKSQLIFSGAWMAIAHAMLGYYFYVNEQGDASYLRLLPLSALMLYIATYSLGFGPLPWAVMGEMFGNDVKATASALSTTITCILGFFLTLNFRELLDVVGQAWTFWTFGICCALACVYIGLLIPNTKGKSLQQIQHELSGRVK